MRICFEKNVHGKSSSSQTAKRGPGLFPSLFTRIGASPQYSGHKIKILEHVTNYFSSFLTVTLSR